MPEKGPGHLGKLSLSLHWMNLGNQPVEVLVEDVYLLVVPSSESTYDPEEEESRVQAAKFERLENAELLSVRPQTGTTQGQQAAFSLPLRREAHPLSDNAQSQGLLSSLVTKIINNLQITVRNIHIRYEDKLSVPGVSGSFAAAAAFNRTLLNFRPRPLHSIRSPRVSPWLALPPSR